MTIVNPDIPSALRENTLIKHLDDPYSEAALGEPHKDIIDLGRFPMNSLPGSFATPYKKTSGDESSSAHRDADFEPIIDRFERVTKYLLSSEAFRDASIATLFETRLLQPGQTHIPLSTHLDGVFPRNNREPQLRFSGLGVSDIATGAYQGPVEIDDFELEPLQILMHPGTVKNKGLKAELLPVNRLFLFSPSLPHFSRPATQEVTRYMFRWFVHI